VRTFGKGSVQSIVNLGENQGALKLTTAFFQSPNGRSIDRQAGGEAWGVDPSDGCYVPLDADKAAALGKLRRERTALGKPSDDPLPALSPQTIRERMSDPQLAAGFEAALARLTGGKFPPVGEELPAQTQDGRREALGKQRQALIDELQRLELELKVLDKSYRHSPQR
jgi:hypothetical protein